MLWLHTNDIAAPGESGAGKTEAMKICLTYVGELSLAKMKNAKEKMGRMPGKSLNIATADGAAKQQA